jgi:hypothetical protein
MRLWGGYPVKVLAAAAFAFVLLAWPPAALAQVGEEPAPTPASPDFYPSKYLGQGNVFNCPDFVSQADAQAVLRADPNDPNKLDTDRPHPDGIACESNPAPFDAVPVPR